MLTRKPFNCFYFIQRGLSYSEDSHGLESFYVLSVIYLFILNHLVFGFVVTQPEANDCNVLGNASFVCICEMKS